MPFIPNPPTSPFPGTGCRQNPLRMSRTHLFHPMNTLQKPATMHVHLSPYAVQHEYVLSLM